jgi:hypothetical protein
MDGRKPFIIKGWRAGSFMSDKEYYVNFTISQAYIYNDIKWLH